MAAILELWRKASGTKANTQSIRVEFVSAFIEPNIVQNRLDALRYHYEYNYLRWRKEMCSLGPQNRARKHDIQEHDDVQTYDTLVWQRRGRRIDAIGERCSVIFVYGRDSDRWRI